MTSGVKRTGLWGLAVLCALGTSAVFADPPSGSGSGKATAAAAQIVGSLVVGNYPGALKPLDESIRSAISPEQLQSAWEGVTRQLGHFKRQVGVRTENASSIEMVYVTCQFERGVMDVKVAVNAAGAVSGFWFVPTEPPHDTGSASEHAPSGLREREVTVGESPWTLPGTLTLPSGPGPFPTVVLVHGSGPHDRDESIGLNRPFRDLAWGLAARGVAVLRYEKRTKARVAELIKLKDTLTVKEETVDDALAAVALLRRTPEISSRQIVVLGHSLGGMLIPRIGVRDPGIAGLIVMAGTTRSMEDVILSQMKYLASLDGTASELKQAQLDKIAQQVALVKSPSLSRDTPAEQLPFGVAAAYWLDLRDYHPAEEAAKLAQPILILQGQRDYQVTMEDYAGWEETLRKRPSVTFNLYPNLNHLFMTGAGKSGPADYAGAGHVAETVIDDIARWVKTTARGRDG